MSKKLKLTKITLETKDGKQVDLTLDEAKELHDQLHDLFGTKFVPSAQIIIERDRYTWQQPYRQYWYDVTYKIAVPMNGGIDVQCKVEGCTGLKATYSGSAI